jgi:hypothetical protein
MKLELVPWVIMQARPDNGRTVHANMALPPGVGVDDIEVLSITEMITNDTNEPYLTLCLELTEEGKRKNMEARARALLVKHKDAVEHLKDK